MHLLYQVRERSRQRVGDAIEKHRMDVTLYLAWEVVCVREARGISNGDAVKCQMQLSRYRLEAIQHVCTANSKRERERQREKERERETQVAKWNVMEIASD